MGLAVTKRDQNFIQLRTPLNTFQDFNILQLFPFTSESKRMGIIVKVFFIFFVPKREIFSLLLELLPQLTFNANTGQRNRSDNVLLKRSRRCYVTNNTLF